MRKKVLMAWFVVVMILAACGDTGTTNTDSTQPPLGPALTETIDDSAADVEPSPTRED